MTSQQADHAYELAAAAKAATAASLQYLQSLELEGDEYANLCHAAYLVNCNAAGVTVQMRDFLSPWPSAEAA